MSTNGEVLYNETSLPVISSARLWTSVNKMVMMYCTWPTLGSRPAQVYI